MDKFIRSNRGKKFLVSIAQAVGDQFFESCRQESMDLETLGMFTAEQLSDESIAGMPMHLALGLYNKVQALLHRNDYRIESVLAYNAMTQIFLSQLEPLIEEFREMVAVGHHPLGPTAEEARAARERQQIQKDLDDLENARNLDFEEELKYQVRVDARVKISPESEDCVRTQLILGTNMPEDPGWARGYGLEFADRMVGDLQLQEVWVDLMLPEGAAAFVFVVDPKKSTGKPVHRSTNTEKGKGMEQLQYRFEMGPDCEVSNQHAVMVHITARNVPSRFGAQTLVIDNHKT